MCVWSACHFSWLAHPSGSAIDSSRPGGPRPEAAGVLQGSSCQSQFALQCKAGLFVVTAQTGDRTLST
jgi:hypothetical protein